MFSSQPNPAETASATARDDVAPAPDLASLRVLICISSYGTASVPFLLRILEEWDRMPFRVCDVALFCTHPPELPSFSRVRVQIHRFPPEIRHFLTHQHRPVMAAGQGKYDLFVYTEDDLLINEQNILTFLRLSARLPPGYVPGFLPYEIPAATGEPVYTVTNLHSHHYPSVRKLVRLNGMTFARMGNEHQGGYLLTAAQFDLVLRDHRSHYLVLPRSTPPHVGWGYMFGGFGTLETGASNVYLECGLTRVCWIDDLPSISIRHLPNRYCDVLKAKIENHELMQPGDFTQPALARWMRFAPTWRNLYWWCHYGTLSLGIKLLGLLGIPTSKTRPR